MRVLVTFASAREASRCSRLLEESGIAISVTAVPEDISAECGMALFVKEEDRTACENIIAENRIRATMHERI